jgi:hypothetical protein
MRGVVKPPLAVAGPKHTVTVSCVYDPSCVHDHSRTLKMVAKELAPTVQLRPWLTTISELVGEYTFASRRFDI